MHGDLLQRKHTFAYVDRWQNGGSSGSIPIIMRSYARAFNIVGNVMGQPGYHTQYQTYATSNSAGVGASAENTSIYTLGWALTGPPAVAAPPLAVRIATPKYFQL